MLKPNNLIQLLTYWVCFALVSSRKNSITKVESEEGGPEESQPKAAYYNI